MVRAMIVLQAEQHGLYAVASTGWCFLSVLNAAAEILPPPSPGLAGIQADQANAAPAYDLPEGRGIQLLHAAIRVLEDAGYHVIIPEEDACCGLTWISTGQLDGAKRRLTHLLGVPGPYAEAGIPIVGRAA